MPGNICRLGKMSTGNVRHVLAITVACDVTAESLEDIEGLVELGVTSASKGFWFNVHENVRLHA